MANAKSTSVMTAVHSTARGLRKAGLMDAKTMRDFDVLCLPRVKPLTPAQIRRIRARTQTSQAVFAAYLNTSISTVQKWERGEKSPDGPSLKLLNLVANHGIQVLL